MHNYGTELKTHRQERTETIIEIQPKPQNDQPSQSHCPTVVKVIGIVTCAIGTAASTLGIPTLINYGWLKLYQTTPTIYRIACTNKGIASPDNCALLSTVITIGVLAIPTLGCCIGTLTYCGSKAEPNSVVDENGV